MKLGAVSSTLTGATVTGPTGRRRRYRSTLGATNPNPGDALNITLNMPDGTTQSIQLTATTTSPPPAGSFTIGATPAATAANLQTALQTSINTVANTSLVAASAMEASSNFFDQPPQRVSVTPPGTFATATSLVAGTSANTVSWYTGGTSTGSARATQVALDRSGADRELRHPGQRAGHRVAVAGDRRLRGLYRFAQQYAMPPAQVSAMSASVAQALSTQPNQQSIQDIQTDLANAQTTMSTASSLQTQTQSYAAGYGVADRDRVARPGRQPDSGAADQPSGVLSDHLDAIAAQPGEIPADSVGITPGWFNWAFKHRRLLRVAKRIVKVSLTKSVYVS